VTNTINLDGTFKYRVEAIEDLGNQYGFKEQSMSNETPAIQNPVVFVPNAFTPNGFNPYFKPTVIFVDQSTYVFHIYDRWGELIFETNNVLDAWDGEFKGEPAPQGVYVYMIKVSGANGKEVVKKGPVTLLR
ncbi:MAG: gliding motility-associated C-terminal domain-containing protein, partial [Bacteroidia bacterium]|nr:gliding motility-associated C-terminal domain-containing protein [Bacteroidia bacterium]